MDMRNSVSYTCHQSNIYFPVLCIQIIEKQQNQRGINKRVLGTEMKCMKNEMKIEDRMYEAEQEY